MPLFDAGAIRPAHQQHAFTSSDDQFACLRRGKSINSTRVLPRTGSALALVGPEAVSSRRARHDERPTTAAAAAAAGPSVDRAGAHVGGGEAAPALRPVHSLYRGRPVWVPKPPRQPKRSATSMALEIALEKLKHGPSPVHPEEIPRLMGFEIPRLPRGPATDPASSSASSHHQRHSRDNPFDRTNAAGSPSSATPAAPLAAIATGGGSRGNVARVGTLGGRGQSPTSATSATSSANSPGSSSPSSGRRSPGSRGGFRPKKRAGQTGQTGRTDDMMDRPIISSAGLGLGKPLYNAAHGDASMVGFVKVRESTVFYRVLPCTP